MIFMVVERFRDTAAVYRRLREKGRMMPHGLQFLSSWVNTNQGRCFQLVETSDPGLLNQWAEQWSDLVDFEFVEVTSSDFEKGPASDALDTNEDN